MLIWSACMRWRRAKKLAEVTQHQEPSIWVAVHKATSSKAHFKFFLFCCCLQKASLLKSGTAQGMQLLEGLAALSLQSQNRDCSHPNCSKNKLHSLLLHPHAPLPTFPSLLLVLLPPTLYIRQWVQQAMQNRNRNTERNPGVSDRELWTKMIFHYQNRKAAQGKWKTEAKKEGSKK